MEPIIVNFMAIMWLISGFGTALNKYLDAIKKWKEIQQASTKESDPEYILTKSNRKYVSGSVNASKKKRRHADIPPIQSEKHYISLIKKAIREIKINLAKLSGKK
jgi:hypothetical protein